MASRSTGLTCITLLMLCGCPKTEAPADAGSGQSFYSGSGDSYPCHPGGSQVNVKIRSNDDWVKFYNSGCSEVHDLKLQGDLSDFGGLTPVDLLVTGDLVINSTQLTALTEEDAFGFCSGLCRVYGVQGRIRILGNERLSSAELPALVRSRDGLSVRDNPALTRLVLALGDGGYSDVEIKRNVALEQVTLTGTPTADVTMKDNGSLGGPALVIGMRANTPHPVVMGKLTLKGNPSLTGFLFQVPGSTVRVHEITVKENPVLAEATLPKLSRIETDLTVEENPSLTDLQVDETGGAAAFVVKERVEISGNGSAGTNLSITLALAQVGQRFRLENNPASMVLSFPQLTAIGGQLTVGGNEGMTSLEFPALSQVGIHPHEDGGIFVGANSSGEAAPNPALSVLRFPALRQVGMPGDDNEGHARWAGDVTLSFTAATEVLVGGAAAAADAGLRVFGDLNIIGSVATRGLQLAQLEQVGRFVDGAAHGGAMDIPWFRLNAPLTRLAKVYDGFTAPGVPNLADLGLSALTHVGAHPRHRGKAKGLTLSDPAIASMSGAFPALIAVGSLTINGTALDHLDFPALQRATGKVKIIQNAQLKNVSLPALSQVDGLLKIKNNGLGLAAEEYLFLHPVSGADGLCSGNAVADPAWCSSCSAQNGQNPAPWCSAPAVGSPLGFAALTSANKVVIKGNRNAQDNGGLPWCFADLFVSRKLAGFNADQSRNHNPPAQAGMPCVDLQVNPCRDQVLGNGPNGEPEVCDASVNCDEDSDCGAGNTCDVATGTCYLGAVTNCLCGGSRSCSLSCDQVILECDDCCPNGQIDGLAGEQCDGNTLPGDATCLAQAGANRSEGEVTCDEACQLDSSDCYGCGDGIVQDTDPGREECDPADPNGPTGGLSCQSLGLGGGSLTCGAAGSPEACQYVRSGCFSTCDHLRHYYRFEEVVNARAHDAITGQWGSYVGNRGQFSEESESLSFQASHHSISLPYDSLAQEGGDGSIALWVRPMSQGNLMGGQGWRVFLAEFTNKMRLRLESGPFVVPPNGEDIVVDYNDWFMVTLVWDQENIRLYLDGERIFEVAHQQQDFTLRGPLILGAHTGMNEESFRGWADEAAIFKGALNDLGVQELYKRSMGRGETDLYCEVNVCGDLRVARPNSLGMNEECDGPLDEPGKECTLPGTTLNSAGQLQDCKIAHFAPPSTGQDAGPQADGGWGWGTGHSFCGDGLTRGMEACDPPGSSCVAQGQRATCGSDCSCQLDSNVCGNQALESGEDCDPPILGCSPGSSCNPANCQCEPDAEEPVCGDSMVGRGETCDGTPCPPDFKCSNCQCVSIDLLCDGPGSNCGAPGTLCSSPPPRGQDVDWDGDGFCDGWPVQEWSICRHTGSAVGANGEVQEICSCEFDPPGTACCWQGTPNCPPAPPTDGGPPDAGASEDGGSHCGPSPPNFECEGTEYTCYADHPNARPVTIPCRNGCARCYSITESQGGRR